ncbi:MAG: Chromosome partitioning protein ParA [Parachlamydiales bacterium]|nr:Chromosome partitioning protein ParA [Parachlamydiales bacterium]
MRTFVFCSFKGGTAKTSTALHIGACLAQYHAKRVLLIDFDSQANLSTGIGIGPDNLDTMVPVLRGEKKAIEVIQPTCIRGLDIIPANTYLDGIESSAPLVSDLYAHERLRKAIIGLPYDICLIDTPPSLGWLTQAAFYAAHSSVICALPEPYSILAMNRLKEYHAAIQEHHPLSCSGVVISFWDERGATNVAFLEAIHAAFPELLFCSKIRRDIAVNRAILQGKPVIVTEEKSRASTDYRELAKEFIKRVDA